MKPFDCGLEDESWSSTTSLASVFTASLSVTSSSSLVLIELPSFSIDTFPSISEVICSVLLFSTSFSSVICGSMDDESSSFEETFEVSRLSISLLSFSHFTSADCFKVVSSEGTLIFSGTIELLFESESILSPGLSAWAFMSFTTKDDFLLSSIAVASKSLISVFVKSSSSGRLLLLINPSSFTFDEFLSKFLLSVLSQILPDFSTLSSVGK